MLEIVLFCTKMYIYHERLKHTYNLSNNYFKNKMKVDFYLLKHLY